MRRHYFNIDIHQLQAVCNAWYSCSLWTSHFMYFFFCLLGGQVVQFRLASCGQDSHLKIWAINKFSYGGKKMFYYVEAEYISLSLSGSGSQMIFCHVYSTQ